MGFVPTAHTWRCASAVGASDIGVFAAGATAFPSSPEWPDPAARSGREFLGPSGVSVAFAHAAVESANHVLDTSHTSLGAADL